ncbi:putative anterograde trans-synaptic signaling [Trypoxylus dichotomus]
MEERKRSNRNLAKALDRHTEQLVTNYTEDIRTINEEKSVIENTNIIYPHDRYRGNPSFWRVPQTLRKQPCQPDYFSVMTSAQKCEIPTMEYVKVPNAIRHEKNAITAGYRNSKMVWDKSNYRKKRIKELKEQIEIVEPFKPDLDNLFIKGISITSTNKEYFERVPSDLGNISDVSTSGHVILPTDIHSDEDYLMVDNVRLCNHLDSDVNVYLNFEYNTSSKQVLIKAVKLMNGTSYALRYSFIRKKKFNLFRDIVQDKEEEVFFYNKRESVLLPNQCSKFPITIKTDFPCTYKLQLILQTRPNLWKYSLIINLMAIATDHDLSDKCASIKQHMESEANKLIARDLVQDMLTDIHLKEDKDKPATFYIYDKPTLFQVMNQKFTPVTKRPKYIYKKDIVEELENFYLKVRLPDAPASWDLNIENLREMTKKRQDINYRKTFIEELINIKKPPDEKKNANLKSTSALKQRSFLASKSTLTKSKSVISRQEEHKTFAENLTEELEAILLKLQQFTMWFNENRTLYESCYTVICTAFDTILEEIQRIETDLNIRKVDKYPEHFDYNSHVFEGRVEEIHHDLPGQAPRIKEDFIADAKPVAECLKDIPLDNSKARYNVYYGIEENTTESKEKGKTKKGNKEKPNKKDTKEKKGKDKDTGRKTKSQEKLVTKAEVPDVNLKENPEFNIDAKPPVPEVPSKISLKQSQSSEDDSSDVTSGLLLKEYKRSLYDVFYHHILEAAVKLADIIELHKHEEIRMENIKRMIEQASVKQPPVQMRVVDLKEAIRVAMELPKKYRSLYSDVPEKPEPIETKFDESVQKKEEGSEWSILKPLKAAEPTVKPISYPDTSVYLKKKIRSFLFKDVGTIMSNAGIDPNWQDFKDVGVQIVSKRESRPEKEEFVATIIGDVVDEICREGAAAETENESIEKESGSKPNDVLFCCDEIPVIPSKPTQNINDNKEILDVNIR